MRIPFEIFAGAGDTIDKIEIEVKEVKDKLSSLTASAEKSVQG